MKRLFQIFAIAALALGFTACEQTGETPTNEEVNITLEADKSEILADGTDIVTFTALVNNKSNNDVQIICLNDNKSIKGNTFTTTEAGEYEFAAIYNKKSSNRVKVMAVRIAGSELELTADKQNVIANGSDVVTFTVTFDGEDVTSLSTITDTNNNVVLESNTFTTIAAGEYTFVAEYNEQTSAPFSVVATYNDPVQKSLKLVASKMRIKADGEDKVTFTATYGEEDVTATCELHTTNGDVIEGNVFTATTIGTYNIYAIYDNQRSNTVSIDAYDPNATYAYEIGKIYEINGSKGVAYAIKNNYAYFFSIDEADLQWSTENVMCNCISTKGDWNTYDPFDPTYSKADGGVRDINNYPAFKWCMEHGEGWYMPSSTELQWVWDAISEGTHKFDSTSVDTYNKLLTDNGGMPFVSTYYSSSNETAADRIELIAFMEDSVVCLEPFKSSKFSVRAVIRVQLN